MYQRHRDKKSEAPKRRCHRCHGTGTAPCRICGGTGKLPKGADANGHMTFGTCEGCMGRKTCRCATCNGEHFI